MNNRDLKTDGRLRQHDSIVETSYFLQYYNAIHISAILLCCIKQPHVKVPLIWVFVFIVRFTLFFCKKNPTESHKQYSSKPFRFFTDAKHKMKFSQACWW